jgi:transcriptional regulator with XRE-family HTH domain
MKTKKFSELRDSLYERSPKSRDRVESEVARLTEQLGLSELRARMKRTQSEIAEAIGTSQSGVSRLERQEDTLISTLRDYVTATGGELCLIARYPDFEHEIRLPVLSKPHGPMEPRRFRVVWQSINDRQFVHVGWLIFENEIFRFSYTPDAELRDDFEPFPAFPDFRGTFESSDLFPFFASRLSSTATSEHLLSALGLTREDATPTELLARSWGATPHDTIQIVPEPHILEDGSEVRPFLVSGVRHADETNLGSVTKRIQKLKQGEELSLLDEPENPHNERAIVVEAGQIRVGWVPDYLLDYVHKKRSEGMQPHIYVEKANGPEAPWHLRLLCLLEMKSA